MLTIRKVTKSFNARVLFQGADMTVNYGERVALVGPNGAGKSTLFSLILGTDTADSGEVNRDEWTSLGYLAQEGEPVGEETVLDIATGKAGEMDRLEAILQEHEKRGDVSAPAYFDAQAKHEALQNPQAEARARKILRGFGYKEEDFTRPAREFSGGWVMRAHLARLLVIEPDLLLLDEPTNHLDLLSLLWFRSYLKHYPGAVLMISHDRDFMDEIIEKIYEIDNSKLTQWTGNYSSYLKQKEEAWERERRQSAERLTELEAQIESERRAERQRASDLERRAEHERREAEAAAVLSTALAQQGLAERTLREAEQRRADEDAAAFAAQLLREAAEEERLERLGTRAAMSFRNQKLNSGFVTWKDMARVRRHQRRRAAGVLHSLRDLRVRRALN
jgi:ATP-binding cassette subfamily F protein 3